MDKEAIQLPKPKKDYTKSIYYTIGALGLFHLVALGVLFFQETGISREEKRNQERVTQEFNVRFRSNLSYREITNQLSEIGYNPRSLTNLLVTPRPPLY